MIILTGSVQGLQLGRDNEGSDPAGPLNQTAQRDPDAYPPSNTVELVGTWVFQAITAFGRGNLLFAVKGAVLTVLMSLPAFMATSAAWAYGVCSLMSG